MTLTAEELRSLLSYDQDTGLFTWRVSRGKAVPGRLAGVTDSYGYLVIKIDRKLYKAHRLAWLYVHSEWPRMNLDHINAIKTDNRISNLREATFRQNKANTPIQRNNTSGLKGVFWYAKIRKWRASIGVYGRRIRIGDFLTAEEAHDAYAREASLQYGEFARRA